MVIMPVVIARWRLGKRGEMLGFRKGMAWMQWAGIAIVAISIPALGEASKNGSLSNTSETAMKVSIGALVALICWIGARALLGSSL